VKTREECAEKLYELLRKQGLGATDIVRTTRPPGVEVVVSEEVRLRFFPASDVDPLLESARVLRAKERLARIWQLDPDQESAPLCPTSLTLWREPMRDDKDCVFRHVFRYEPSRGAQIRLEIPLGGWPGGPLAARLTRGLTLLDERDAVMLEADKELHLVVLRDKFEVSQ
jgi:hypothetical protein